MNIKIKRLLHALGIGAGALVICTILYAATGSRVIEINDVHEFDTFIHAEEHPLVLVEFFSPTCPVCNAFKKKGIFAHASNQMEDVEFVMVSSEAGRELHRIYDITQFPTFVYFKDGKPLTHTNEKGQITYKHPGYVDEPSFTPQARAIFESAK